GAPSGYGKSGSFTDQFGNWKCRPSQRSLRQRSATRLRSTTRCGRPRLLSMWLMASPACPPPMISVSTRSLTTAKSLLRGLRHRFGLAPGAPFDELLHDDEERRHEQHGKA